MSRVSLGAAVLTCALVVGCGSDGAKGSAGSAGSGSDAGAAHDGAAHAAPHWTYEGEEGPDHWGTLSTDYATCATGHEQSPIDLNMAMGKDLPNITYAYQEAALDIVNNGHTIQVNYAPGSSITADGSTYNLLQFHFHHPSEHTVAGKSYPLELHLVHKAADGSLAVVGVLIDAGAENPAFGPVWSNLPTMKDQEIRPTSTLNAMSLLPTRKEFFRYAGSLTTPPCSEGVKWSVLKTPITMAQAQIDKFAGLFALNARPVQALQGRELAEDSTP